MHDIAEFLGGRDPFGGLDEEALEALASRTEVEFFPAGTMRRLRQRPAAEREPIALSAMANELGLPVHRPHHADGDALTTAQAFVALATHLEAFATPTVGSLERVSHPERGGSSIQALLGRLGLGRGHA